MHYERVRVHGDPHVTLTPQRGLAPEVQYERYVDRTSTPDGCHLWSGPTFSNGYGSVKYEGVMHLAHRWGYQHYVGPIPGGRVVRHTCDVPACQNPEHWLLGSPADNNRDRDERGRTAMGSRHWNSQLTEDQVSEIRLRYAAGGVTQQALANEFSTTQANISEIVRRTSWKQVT